jgi:hypothetical protein
MSLGWVIHSEGRSWILPVIVEIRRIQGFFASCGWMEEGMLYDHQTREGTHKKTRNDIRHHLLHIHLVLVTHYYYYYYYYCSSSHLTSCPSRCAVIGTANIVVTCLMTFPWPVITRPISVHAFSILLTNSTRHHPPLPWRRHR